MSAAGGEEDEGLQRGRGGGLSRGGGEAGVERELEGGGVDRGAGGGGGHGSRRGCAEAMEAWALLQRAVRYALKLNLDTNAN
jgi:hypothetical protein